ncbi:MAG: hypothetical protein ABJD97_03175 [Betaproteobacteria bacterium]
MSTATILTPPASPAAKAGLCHSTCWTWPSLSVTVTPIENAKRLVFSPWRTRLREMSLSLSRQTRRQPLRSSPCSSGGPSTASRRWRRKPAQSHGSTSFSVATTSSKR